MRTKLIRVLILAAVAWSTAIPARAGSGADAERLVNRAGSAGASGDAARTPAGSSSRASVGPTTPGIDVSHWQGEVDWAKVSASGKRFVFLKATDGIDYIDPTYATNRAGARAAGVLVGAYHFARPDTTPGDARREARFFIETADPRPGNLLPVLDIETNDGLDQDGVTKWARAWVDEVRQLTGVTPMVYTSPYGWLTRTGDTRLLARDGAPLWVAHWGVESPTLPAGEWDGHGWVVWQYSSTGRVPGIVGNVDLDVLAGTRLGRVRIRQLSIVVDGGVGRVSSEPVHFGCSNICRYLTDPDETVTLIARPDDGAYFTGWTGACGGTGPTCTIDMRSNRAVGATFVTDVTPPTATVRPPTNFSDAAVVRFDEVVRGVTDSNVLIRELGGTRLAVTRTCRTGAGVKTRCDVGKVRTIILRPRTHLVPGRDYVAVVNPGGAHDPISDRVGNGAGTTHQAFEGSARVDQTDEPVIERPPDAWKRVEDPGASGGSYVVADRAGAVIRLSFDGTGVDWITTTGPNRGRAQVYVDGDLVRTLDLYASRRSFGVARRFHDLTNGRHTLRILVTGRSRSASHGALVPVDRFDVLG